MSVKELEVFSTITWHDHRYSAYYNESLDALMIPTIIGSGVFEQLFYLKINGDEIRKCLEHKEVKE